MMLYCGSDSACRIVRNCPWNPASFLVKPAVIPTVRRIFPTLLSWLSAGKLCYHFPSWYWGVSGFWKLHSFFNFSNRSTSVSRIYHCFSFYAHSPICQWLRWSYDHRGGSGLVPQVCGWRNWCRPVASPWSTSPPVILKVAASWYLPHLPFGVIGPLGMHDDGCTLELHLQPHWLALEVLVGDRLGAENFAQLMFCMWIVALPSQGDHAVSLPFLTGWLTHLLVFSIYFEDDFVVNDPLTFLLDWRLIFCENLQVWNSFLVILVSLILVCLNFLESISPILVCLNFSGIVRILFSCVLARLDFFVLVLFVFRLGLRLPCLFPFLIFC